MKKFEIGAMYWDTSAVDHNDVMVIKITRRTEKSVWFVRMRGDQPEGEPARTKIFTNATYEYIMPYRYSMAPVWEADRKVEPEAAANDEPQEAASDATEAADDNKAAAMTAQEETARKMIHEQTTEYLLNQWEATTANNDPFIPTVRGWLMDELESRHPEAFNAWSNSETCEDAALREYIEWDMEDRRRAMPAEVEAAERAAQDSLEAETDAPAEAQDSAEAGQPAPQEAEAGTTLTLTPEQAKLLLTALCSYANVTRADIARCSAPDALPTEKRLIEHYQRQKALNEELRAALYKMAFAPQEAAAETETAQEAEPEPKASQERGAKLEYDDAGNIVAAA